LERRKSFCGQGGNERGEGTPSPTKEAPLAIPLLPESQVLPELNVNTTAAEEDTRDDVADRARKISLVEMQQNRRKAQAQEELENENDTENLLTTKYDHSSDERGGSPAPAIIRKMTQEHSGNIPTSVIQELRKYPSVVYEEGRLSTEEELNPLNMPIDNEVTFDSSYKIQVPVTLVDPDIGPSGLGTVMEDGSDGNPSSHKDMDPSIFNNSSNSSNNCDSGDGDEDEKGFEDSESNDLWLRTEALVTSRSFNMAKRRVSESN
jgi:hypothetical protein